MAQPKEIRFPGPIITPNDFIGRNRDRDYLPDSRSGVNPNVDTLLEDFWMPGGEMIWLSTAETMDIVSTSVNDSSAGTGARLVRIIGVDDNRDLVTEIVAMNGTTPVTTVNTFLVVNELLVLTFGATGYNEGDITATSTSTANLQNFMEIRDSVSLSLNFTLPTGFAFLSYQGVFSIESAQDVEIKLFARNPTVGTGGWINIVPGIVGPSGITVASGFPFLLPEHTDVSIKARKVKGSSGAVSGILGGYSSTMDNIISPPKATDIGI